MNIEYFKPWKIEYARTTSVNNRIDIHVFNERRIKPLRDLLKDYILYIWEYQHQRDTYQYRLQNEQDF